MADDFHAYDGRESVADDPMELTAAMRLDEIQAHAAIENAAQVPGPGESSLVRRPGYGGDVREPDARTDREFLVLVTATVVTGLAAGGVAYLHGSPEAGLLVVSDLGPWLIGLAGVYIICRTVMRVAEKWQ
jgi:hypothetical protein